MNKLEKTLTGLILTGGMIGIIGSICELETLKYLGALNIGTSGIIGTIYSHLSTYSTPNKLKT